MKLQFLGATRQVTGSRYFLDAGGLQLLIDCGMFQERAYLGRNWGTTPIDPAKIDALLLTHAHLDHTGLIPRFVKRGFNSPIYSTPATLDLTRIVLLDAAGIQQEDVRNKIKRHEEENRVDENPIEPLYTEDDAHASLRLLRPVKYEETLRLNDRVSVTWRDAGHILGSSLLEIVVREAGVERRIIFSGDIGQWDKPLIRDPSLIHSADYVVMESTYGDRNHAVNGGIEEQLAAVVNQTIKRGGNVLIPTFAIERAQELMFYFSRLVRRGKLRDVRVFLDSPMAVEATEVMARHPECLDEEARAMLRSNESPFRFPGLHFTRSVEESKEINGRSGVVIMAGSGMCNAGRIKHHLIQNIGKPETTVLFVGYQAEGTLGRELVDGQKEVRILGKQYPVQAQIAEISGLSAHADQKGLLHWLDAMGATPKRLFLTHGEERAANTLAEIIRRRAKYPVDVPGYMQAVELF